MRRILISGSSRGIGKAIALKLMKEGAKILEGTHDFSTYRASSCSSKSPIKKMLPIKIRKKNDRIRVRLSSKSFLQNQVRSIIADIAVETYIPVFS